MAIKRKIIPGGVGEYIRKCPADIQENLNIIRKAIQSVVPDATETLSYFQFPGYHYEGNYYYNGMFVWFSYKSPFIRFHIYPEVIKNNKKYLEEFTKGAGVVNFPEDKQIPIKLVKKLVLESLQAMKDRTKVKL